MVIFGAAGDLTRRQLVPALFELHCQQLLPEPFAVVGFSHGTWDSQTFREEMRRAVAQSCGSVQDWEVFARRLSFVSGDATSAPHEGYATLSAEIDRVRELWRRPFFELADDNSFVNRKYWQKLLPELEKRKIRWFTEADIAVGDDPEFLAQLYRAGCKEVLIGLESSQLY